MHVSEDCGEVIVQRPDWNYRLVLYFGPSRNGSEESRKENGGEGESE